MLRIFIRSCSRMPFYAVRTGRKPGIYNSWSECQAQIKGYPKAAFKKFDTTKEAQLFIDNVVSSKVSSYHHLAADKRTSFKSKSELPSRKRTTLLSQDVLRTLHNTSGTSDFPTAPVVYSDGCCFNNGTENAVGGVGVYWAPHHPRNVSEPLKVEIPTNQIAELRAASRALETAIEMDLSKVELRTDSTYTIKAMTEWINTWKKNGWKTSDGNDVKNKTEMLRLYDLCNKIDVKWVHVAGHKGFYGNEEADRLARDGARKVI